MSTLKTLVKPIAKPLVIPKRIRRPEREGGRMTFIVGMHCDKGLILCSDSLESDNYDKRNVKKLFHYDRAEWGVAWGCAGDSDVIHRFTEKLQIMLDKESDGVDWLRLQLLIESVAHELHERYERALLQIIVGVWLRNPMTLKLCRMDVLQGNCLSVEDDYACVGMDLSLGKFVLSNLWGKSLSVELALNLAVLVTQMMKKTADGVGGPTQLITCEFPGAGWKDHSNNFIRKHEHENAAEDIAELIQQYWLTNFPS